MTVLTGRKAEAVLGRLKGLRISEGFDVRVSQCFWVKGRSPGRWLFIRFHRDGSAAVVKLIKEV